MWQSNCSLNSLRCFCTLLRDVITASTWRTCLWCSGGTRFHLLDLISASYFIALIVIETIKTSIPKNNCVVLRNLFAYCNYLQGIWRCPWRKAVLLRTCFGCGSMSVTSCMEPEWWMTWTETDMIRRLELLLGKISILMITWVQLWTLTFMCYTTTLYWFNILWISLYCIMLYIAVKYLYYIFLFCLLYCLLFILLWKQTLP